MGNRSQYKWEEKKYLYPVPASSVTMNDNLDQNAGWGKDEQTNE